jgi:hypothetical protein
MFDQSVQAPTDPREEVKEERRGSRKRRRRRMRMRPKFRERGEGGKKKRGGQRGLKKAGKK